MFKILVTALFVSAGMLAPQGLSAQQRVVKVQGHPHELLTRRAAEGTALRAVSPPPRDISYVDPANIGCWIDEPNLSTSIEIDSAILMIKFTDGKNIDSLFVWGYRWNPYKVYGADTSFVQHHGIDMIRTVANNDKRLTVMLQYTGENGHTVGGIGADLYNDGASCSRVSLDFDMAGAGPVGKGVNFSYFSLNEYCNLGQVTYPYINANTRTGQAATESRYTGILVHPFGAEYGYPAYDYDYWYYNGYLPDDQHWQSGWSLNGFWGYFRADNWRVPVPSADFDNDPDAAMFGVTYEPLLNHQVQGFVFEPGFVVHQFDGEPRYMDCGCAPCANNVNRKAK